MAGDILIRNAQLRHQPTGDLVALYVRDGLISEIGPWLKAKAEIDIDAKGGLVTESFVNPHLHLDKVYTLDRMDELLGLSSRATAARR